MKFKKLQYAVNQYGVQLSAEDILNDYLLAFKSRQASLLGRKEALSGKAKFGIFGDGKEVAQVALARFFQGGDWRSGYYRDQTMMMAAGRVDIKQFFAQLYADSNPENDPASWGRQMNSHFSTRYIGEKGEWLSQLGSPNSASDISPTGGQMARSVGLAYASKLYRNLDELKNKCELYSKNGEEVCFATIGNASTSEGVFWESINAAGVLQIPLIVSVWDDDYGISVPASYHTTKESISKVLAGFHPDEKHKGVAIYQVQGWDYPSLIKAYGEASQKARKKHEPSLIHVQEMTQPQGHSTSGSHERYKSSERLKYEEEMDCLAKMRHWLLDEELIDVASLVAREETLKKEVKDLKTQAWTDYLSPIKREADEAVRVLSQSSSHKEDLIQTLVSSPTMSRKLIASTLRKAVFRDKFNQAENPELASFADAYSKKYSKHYDRFALCESEKSPLRIESCAVDFGKKPEKIEGRQIIQKYFDKKMTQDSRVFVFGEDVGKIGGVNTEFEGLQEKYGKLRCTDTGIREATILGQGIGAAMRGLRPVVDIQYLDYLLYCFQTMSDDLASMHYRSGGGQLAPVVIRTKGHRLEGIWHSGSPIQMILGGSRGIHLCVPRNMTQATGMYETLLRGDDPGLVIEVLNGYRLKENCPVNFTDFTVPLGLPEVLRTGHHVTLVTYGACVRIALDAADFLETLNIKLEVIDAQTLLPFDRWNIIGTSLEKTNALLCLDEDVPGGASAYMMQQVLEVNKGYQYLDATPRTLSAKPHRPAYGTDGDYYSKPNAEDVVCIILEMVRERQPELF